MELFEKSSPGQVKRISTILIDSIPTDLPKKLTGDLIDKKLRSLLDDLWQTERTHFRNSLREDFKWVTSFQVRLDEKFSFSDYKKKETPETLVLINEFFSEDLTGSEKYPRVRGARKANIVRVARTTSLENFFIYVGLASGYLVGRDGLVQTFEQGSDKISAILRKDEELISLSRHFWATKLRKTHINNNAFYLEMSSASGLEQETILREGEFLLYLTDVD